MHLTSILCQYRRSEQTPITVTLGRQSSYPSPGAILFHDNTTAYQLSGTSPFYRPRLPRAFSKQPQRDSNKTAPTNSFHLCLFGKAKIWLSIQKPVCILVYFFQRILKPSSPFLVFQRLLARWCSGFLLIYLPFSLDTWPFRVYRATCRCEGDIPRGRPAAL